MKKEKINSKDISVVVQGAIDEKSTLKCLKSIRKYLPKAEIILSTWKGSNVKGLEYDILVENDDPGALIHDHIYNLYNNVNRQLVSTQNGLKLAKNKYILKLRTDFYLKGNDFLDFFDLFTCSNEDYKYFNHRVIVSSVYSREFSDLNFNPTPFHVSDFYFFGEADDVKKYFLNTSLMKDLDITNYNHKYGSKKPYMTSSMRYAPEQYFCLSFFKQFLNIKFEDWTDWNNENVELSNNLLFSNFIFLSIYESKICSDKHLEILKKDYNIPGIITDERFIKKYKQLFDKNFKEIKVIKLRKKFNKHVSKFVAPFSCIVSWLGEPLSIFYYAIRLLKEILYAKN